MNLKINHNLTESDIDNIDVRSQLDHQILVQENRESGWIFDKTISMKISLYKTKIERYFLCLNSVEIKRYLKCSK